MEKLTNESMLELSGYSQIISPHNYNQQVSNEHLYIAQADKFLAEWIRLNSHTDSLEIVELGSGPGRILPLLREAAPSAIITAVEIDPVFIKYAQDNHNCANSFVQAYAEEYRHDKKVDFFVSHGLHHHVTKGPKTTAYLKNVADALKAEGRYLLIDEFLPSYSDDNERELRTTIWHCHIIANALKNGYKQLAIEESRILIDDIQEGRGVFWYKNTPQVDFVLSFAEAIDREARKKNFVVVIELTKKLLSGLDSMANLIPTGDRTLDLSRHDFKISLAVLRQEIMLSGLEIEALKCFGKIETIGGVVVCILKKAQS